MKRMISLLASTAIMLMVLPAGTAMAFETCDLIDTASNTVTYSQNSDYSSFDLSPYANAAYVHVDGVTCMMEKGLFGYLPDNRFEVLALNEHFAYAVTAIDNVDDFFTWLHGLDAATTMGGSTMVPSQWFDKLVMREYAYERAGQKPNRTIYSNANSSKPVQAYGSFSGSMALPSGYALYSASSNPPVAIDATDTIGYEMVELRKEILDGGGSVISTEFAASTFLVAGVPLSFDFASSGASFFESIALDIQRTSDNVRVFQMSKVLDQNNGITICTNNANIPNLSSWSCGSSLVTVSDVELTGSSMASPYQVSIDYSYLFKMVDDSVNYIMYQGVGPDGLNSIAAAAGIPEFSDYVLMSTLLILGYAMRNRIPELKAIVNKK